MEKKYQIIYIWSFIIVSSIILLLLYTPLGGDLHQSDSNEYNIVNTSVNFGGEISNSPKRSYTQQSNSGNSVAAIPSYAPKKSRYVSTNNTVGGTNNLSNNGYSVNSKSTLSSAQSTSSGGNGGGGMSTAFGGGGGSNSSENTSSQGFGGGANSPFSSSTPGSSVSVMQKATNDINDLSDPGGEDPIGDPLPVGDGLYFIIAMAVVYVLKTKK